MKKIFTALLFFALLLSLLTLSVFADTGSGTAADQNPFSLLYREILKHSDKLLSALAFLGSVVLAFAYRKGLMPLMRGGLSSLNSAVSALKEETERLSASSNEGISSAVAKLEAAESLISLLNTKLTALEDELMKVNDSQAKNADLKTIMRFQIDMLYEVFMSSSLPAYQKDAIGEKIGEMRRLVAASEDAGNE